MRTKSTFLGIILFLGLTGFTPAQGPAQVGYGVLTPDMRNATPMASVVYGNGQGNELKETSVQAAVLSTQAVLYITVEAADDKNTGIALVNPDLRAANVSFTLSNAVGEVWSTPQVFTLNGYHQLSRFITEFFPDRIPANFSGSLTISSDQPLAILGLRIRGNSLSSIPLADLSATRYPVPVRDGVVGGPNAIIFPIMVFGGGFETSFLILNTAPNAIYGRIDLFQADGTPLTTRLNNQTGNSFNYVIPSRGVMALEDRAR